MSDETKEVNMTETNNENNVAQVEVNGKSYKVELEDQPKISHVVKKVAPAAVAAAPVAKPKKAAAKAAAGDFVIESPLPGTIKELYVKEGQAVKADDVAETNNELRETNANLLAEQAKLMNERMQLQHKIESLEERLKDEESHRILNYKWYMQEQDKVRALVLIIKAMKSDSVTIDQIVERITKAV